jgi:hypothetical protein
MLPSKHGEAMLKIQSQKNRNLISVVESQSNRLEELEDTLRSVISAIGRYGTHIDDKTSVKPCSKISHSLYKRCRLRRKIIEEG